ncbi:MAG: signal peptide peptidase SppA [Sedimentisphaerales bacterium]|nr:signal peptide peptidase SppA [Sedimentisphaerales bacterium]
MDSEQTNNPPEPFGPPQEQGSLPEPSGTPSYAPPPHRPRPGISGWRILWGIFFGLSVLANVGLFLLLFGLIAVFATRQTRSYEETIIREGPADSKIVMINIAGLMYDEQAQNVYRQLQAARKDRNVKGLIVRVNSPGGTISASDQVYEQIRKYRRDKGKPVIAFMQSTAASGGYYASVACDEIVAEPTTITGSIGVVMGHFVFGELLENKLGILPVFLTMGEKKDWPSSFRPPTDQELEYVRERLLKPAYDRFVEVVREGRAKVLTPSQALALADGSIYAAPQALEVGLIDKVGYFDDVVDLIKSRVGLQRVQVVEYRRPFSWFSALGVQKTTGAFKLDRTMLYELGTPEVLYLWGTGTR